jgi:hypothetical protein
MIIFLNTDLQPRDLEHDTKSVHSYDEASLAAGQTYQV